MAVGALALANPDLVQRLQQDASLDPPDRNSYFGGTEEGYTDYPVLDPQVLRSA